METETTISRDIDSSQMEVRYDAACKRLLSEKMILAWILKSCVEEFRDTGVREIADKYIEGTPEVAEVPVAPDGQPAPKITGANTEDTTIHEGTVYYDVRFLAAAPVSGELVRLILNVEAQNDFYPGYPLIKRAIYYCSRMISSQYGTEFTEPHYDGIKKVYSIWICMNPPKNRRNSITRYYMAEENLVGGVKEKAENYDLLTAVMICLSGSGNENYDGVLKLLDVLFARDLNPEEKQQILQNEFDIPMSQKIESEVSLMCNLSEGIWQGGKKEGVLGSIRSLMDTMNWTAEQAMSALKIPETQQPEYKKLLS